MTDASEVVIIGMRAKEIKRTAVITLWLSHSSCAFSDTDITTTGQADHHGWLYSQTLGHCRPKISADTLGSHLDTLHLLLSHSCCTQNHALTPSPPKSYFENNRQLIVIQTFLNMLYQHSGFLASSMALWMPV